MTSFSGWWIFSLTTCHRQRLFIYIFRFFLRLLFLCLSIHGQSFVMLFIHLCFCILQVKWFEQQRILSRRKRDFLEVPSPLDAPSRTRRGASNNEIHFNDEFYNKMWYFVSIYSCPLLTLQWLLPCYSL